MIIRIVMSVKWHKIEGFHFNEFFILGKDVQTMLFV